MSLVIHDFNGDRKRHSRDERELLDRRSWRPISNRGMRAFWNHHPEEPYQHRAEFERYPHPSASSAPSNSESIQKNHSISASACRYVNPREIPL
jgi:hypothetical protein